MHAEWETCFVEVAGKPAILRCDLAAGRELAQIDAPNLLQVQLELEAPGADGLPGAADQARVRELGQELHDWLAALGGRFVAELSGNGLHSWFYYVPCGWLEAANLVHRIGLRRGVALGVEMKPDARHRVYESLLPTEDELRRTRNMQALSTLMERGDDLRQPRPVEHSVRFDNRTQALALAEWARRQGYVVVGMQTLNDGAVVLQFQRVMAPEMARLDADTAEIMAAARQLGGEYQGWETEVRLAQAG